MWGGGREGTNFTLSQPGGFKKVLNTMECYSTLKERSEADTRYNMDGP